MRVHITLDDALVADLDRRVGRGRRSAFISRTVERALEDAERWDEIVSALGSIEDEGHDWDEGPASWVRSNRRSDSHRVG